jgi:hypothetical protein
LRSGVTFTAVPAGVIADSSSCDATHQTYKNGVARCKAAAIRQWRTSLSCVPPLYMVTSESDANKEGIACESQR